MRFVIRTSNKDPLILYSAAIGFAVLGGVLANLFPHARGWILDLVVIVLFLAASTCMAVLFLCLLVIAFGRSPEASPAMSEEEPPC
jgi:hypothetical protein